MRFSQFEVKVRLCSALLMAVLVAVIYSNFAMAVIVHSGDKTILVEWMSSWKNPNREFITNFTSDDCAELVRTNDSNLNQTIWCDSNGRIVAMYLGNPWNGIDVEGNPAAFTRFPEALVNMTELRDIRLAGLGIYGTIPESIFSLKNLVIFSAPINRLWGTIPRAVEAKTDMIVFDVYSNLLTGIIPDFRPMSNLTNFRVGANNFKCPQPYMRPSVTTFDRYPNMRPAGCNFENNLFQGPDDPNGYYCGEELKLYTPNSICHFLPIIPSHYNESGTPEFVVHVPGHAIRLEVTGSRHLFYYVYYDGTVFRNTSYTVDITSLSTYQPKYRLLSSRHVDYPFHSYKSMSKQDAEGRIWRLHSTLDGDRGTFDTIWDFSKPGQVKYSFYMTNWTFPSSSSTDFVKVNFFSAIREPFVGAKSQYPCFVANVGNVFQFGSTVSILDCKTDTTFLSVSVNAEDSSNLHLNLHSNTSLSDIAIEFPLEYLSDNTPYIFNAIQPMLYTLPYGRASSLLFLSYPDNPTTIQHQQLLISDPELKSQIFIFAIGFELMGFQNDALYDPTVAVTFFLDAEQPSSTNTPADATLAASLSVGAIAAIIIVPTVAVAVILVFLFVPKVRMSIQPYFRKDVKWSDSGDLDSTPIKSSAHARPQGWVRATTVHQM